MTYVVLRAAEFDSQAVEPGSGFYSPGEGLAVRRSEQATGLSAVMIMRTGCF
ncbi:hypothetical protein KCP78_25760 [Salmonella enterica subsp. enterica]|nr:hypothetical protein KCP78_25760 [Salmonella enterica subsp. enterica]